MPDSYIETQKKITKESIFASLMQLLENNPISEISITQIAQRAGVSRMAFYRNYSVKEDIIATYLDELFDEFYTKIRSMKDATKYDISVLFFSFFKERKHFVEILIKSGLIYIFHQKLSHYLLVIFKDKENKNKPEYGTYYVQFEAGGLFNVLLEWITNNTKESVEMMAKLINEFAC